MQPIQEKKPVIKFSNSEPRLLSTSSNNSEKRRSSLDLEYILKSIERFEKSQKVSKLPNLQETIVENPKTCNGEKEETEGDTKSQTSSDIKLIYGLLKIESDSLNVHQENSRSSTHIWNQCKISLSLYLKVIHTSTIMFVPTLLVIFLLTFVPWGSAQVNESSACALDNLMSIQTIINQTQQSTSCSNSVQVNPTAYWLACCLPCTIFCFLIFAFSLTMGRPFKVSTVIRAQMRGYLWFVVFYVIPMLLIGILAAKHVLFYYGEFIAALVVVPWFGFMTRKSRYKRLVKFNKQISVKSQKPETPKSTLYDKQNLNAHVPTSTVTSSYGTDRLTSFGLLPEQITQLQHISEKKKRPPWFIGMVIAVTSIFYVLFLIPFFRVSTDGTKMII